ncbi:hypothetical protein RIF29_20138 [Crotalaria pallida]|uniref:Endonuclease/exonuclease/phosphatase domain-containing protein n=1 Tax=Crotalaria pallida TaxID=3830 RepID=A0AAN9F0P7_CROPI
MDSRMKEFMDFTIMSWNIRGASNLQTRRYLRELIRRHHPSILFIMETHVPFAKMSTFWNRVGYFPVAVEEANGHSGGIWALLDVRISTRVVVVDRHFQGVTLGIGSGDSSWMCTGSASKGI